VNVLVRCEICDHWLATVDTDTLSLPIDSSMFKPPGIGYPDPFPFDFSIGWVDMRCPVCRKRPFIEEGTFKTDRGAFVIGQGFTDLKEPDPPERPLGDAEFVAFMEEYGAAKGGCLKPKKGGRRKR